jgi:hypothetical protein
VRNVNVGNYSVTVTTPWVFNPCYFVTINARNINVARNERENVEFTCVGSEVHSSKFTYLISIPILLEFENM